MAFNPKYTITPKINKALVEIERVRGFLDAVKLKDDWIAGHGLAALNDVPKRLKRKEGAATHGPTIVRGWKNRAGVRAEHKHGCVSRRPA